MSTIGDPDPANAWMDEQPAEAQPAATATYVTADATALGDLLHAETGPPGPDGRSVGLSANKANPHITALEVLDHICAANEPQPSVFVREGALARLRIDDEDRASIETLNVDSARATIARRVDFIQVFSATKEPKSVPPPKEVVQTFLHLGEWPRLPRIKAIIEAPTLRADGTIHDVPGYDPAGHTYYRPTKDLVVPAIPDAPSAAQVAAAVAFITDDLFGDFPFVSPADRANAVGLLLTPMVRHMTGVSPLALLDATRAGSGKNLLATIIAIVATGRDAPVFVMPSKEDEMAKTIVAKLLGGASVLVIDEAHDIRSPALAAMLTAEVIEPRLLGGNSAPRIPNLATSMALGNNITVHGDLVRRCYPVRLDAQMSRPWERSGWRHGDLPAWTRAHRGQALAALLTMARGWWASGQPTGQAPTVGSFTGWTRTVGGILHHAGLTDFLGNLDELYDRGDTDALAWQGFLEGIGERYDRGFIAGELAGRIHDDKALEALLPDDLAEKFTAARTPTSFAVALGKALRAKRNTRHGDHNVHVTDVGTDRSKRPIWQVRSDSRVAGVQGVAGVVEMPPARAGARAHVRDGSNTPANPAPLQIANGTGGVS